MWSWRRGWFSNQNRGATSSEPAAPRALYNSRQQLPMRETPDCVRHKGSSPPDPAPRLAPVQAQVHLHPCQLAELRSRSPCGRWSRGKRARGPFFFLARYEYFVFVRIRTMVGFPAGQLQAVSPSPSRFRVQRPGFNINIFKGRRGPKRSRPRFSQGGGLDLARMAFLLSLCL